MLLSGWWLSTPDPVSRDTSHFYRDTLTKVCPLLGRKLYIHHQFVSPYGSHLHRDTFAEVLGSGAAELVTNAVQHSLMKAKGTLISEPRFSTPAKGGRQKEFDHFFCFRDSFGHFLVTFSDASVTFFVTFFVTFLPNSVCQTPFAAG